MKKTYLYLKKHSTGICYLGKTVQDPFKYKGSGKRWLNILKKHGNDIETTILKVCYTKAELVKWGKHYSDLFDVVRSKDFANIREETGDGGDTSSTPGWIKAKEAREYKAWNKGISTGPRSKESIEKQRATMTGKKRGSYCYNHAAKSTAVTIDGVDYPSVSSAARALNSSFYTIRKRNER